MKPYMVADIVMLTLILIAVVVVIFFVSSWIADNDGYPCSVGEPVLSGYTDEKWIDYVDGRGRRSLVLDKVPVYECKLPEEKE